MTRPTFLSLFSGIGGMDLGLEQAGWECVGQVENDTYCNRVLAKHWPDVPRWGDITEVDPDELPRADLVCGGFPCQPVSVAGNQLGQADERWLWPDFARVVAGTRPEWVLIENVLGLRTRGIDAVRADLGRLGYRSRLIGLSACAFGAPHPRRRLFVVAHTDRQALHQQHRRSSGPDRARAAIAVDAGQAGWRQPQPGLCRVADGPPSRLDRSRIAALGNAVVPQVAELIGRRILGVKA